ncbi:MAG: 4'-phosphopantetheinyl transferase superfamily protein [Verrucomicrobiales bacterium]|nr:4'-phosphopantetheinyl transferase superfamily protein [Verrucomicrobiales bacterium]
MDDDSAAGEVIVWRVAIPGSLPARAASWLHAAEIERARRYHREEDALRFTSVRAAARRILAERLRITPQQVVFNESPTGKPFVAATLGPPTEFNVAHSGGLGLLAVSTLGPVGVDLESIDHARPHLEAVEPYLGNEERRAIAILPPAARSRFLIESWVMREAMVKAIGVGLGGVDLRALQRPKGSGLGTVRIPAPHPFDHPQGWWLRWLEAGPEYIAAVVTAGCPKAIQVRDFVWDTIA